MPRPQDRAQDPRNPRAPRREHRDEAPYRLPLATAVTPSPTGTTSRPPWTWSLFQWLRGLLGPAATVASSASAFALGELASSPPLRLPCGSLSLVGLFLCCPHPQGPRSPEAVGEARWQ